MDARRIALEAGPRVTLVAAARHMSSHVEGGFSMYEKEADGLFLE